MQTKKKKSNLYWPLKVLFQLICTHLSRGLGITDLHSTLPSKFLCVCTNACWAVPPPAHSLACSLWPQGHVHWRWEWGGFLTFAYLFPQQHFCSARVASRALNLSPAPFELLTNKQSISQGGKEREREKRERENITANDLAVYKCYTWNHCFFKTHTHAPGHVTSPLSKVNWMNKEMDGADKENKKRPNGREWRINSVGRWVLVSIWAILIHWIETGASTKP